MVDPSEVSQRAERLRKKVFSSSGKASGSSAKASGSSHHSSGKVMVRFLMESFFVGIHCELPIV